MSDTEPTTAALRRRRGVTKASITKLSTRLSEFEAKIDDPMTLGHTQKLQKKLEALDSEFKQQHLTVIDSIPEDDQLDDNLAKEQNELDEHDLIVDDLSLRLVKFIFSYLLLILLKSVKFLRGSFELPNECGGMTETFI